MTSLTEQIVRFSQFRDAPIPKPRDGHVISGLWLTGSLASVVSRLRETGLAGRSYCVYLYCVSCCDYIASCLQLLRHRISREVHSAVNT